MELARAGSEDGEDPCELPPPSVPRESATTAWFLPALEREEDETAGDDASNPNASPTAGEPLTWPGKGQPPHGPPPPPAPLPSSRDKPTIGSVVPSSAAAAAAVAACAALLTLDVDDADTVEDRDRGGVEAILRCPGRNPGGVSAPLAASAVGLALPVTLLLLLWRLLFLRLRPPLPPPSPTSSSDEAELDRR